MFSDTATRVEQHTNPRLNEQIRDETEFRISAYSSQKRSALTGRLQQLDREWDTERTLQTNFATISLLGLSLATSVNKRWFALSFAVPSFMIQHALQGWCPPLAALRRLGFRTAREISEERFALKALRGDFEQAANSGRVDDIIRAVRS